MPNQQTTSNRGALLAAGLLLAVGLALSVASAVLVGYASTRGDPAMSKGEDWPILPLSSGLETDGLIVVHVVPGGPAWAAGLRAGFTVDPTYPTEIGLPDALAACDSTTCGAYNRWAAQSAIARQWPHVLLGLALLALGATRWRRCPPLSGLMGIAAIAVAAPTLALAGLGPLFALLGVASLVGAPSWLRLTSRDRTWVAAAIGAAVLATFWIAAWAAWPDLFGLVESTRVLTTVGLIGAGVVVVSGWIGASDARTPRDRRIDGVVVISVAGVAGFVTVLEIIPAWLAAELAAIMALAYFLLRHRVRSLLTRAASAELGHRGTLLALEAERARVARDIHDVPLQELTAVIHHLDSRPALTDETERLREVARHLRDVSISLRPPVLDDVGLGAALAELADRHTEDGPSPVRCLVVDETGIDAVTRPPADVELAVFRIAQEALTNAQRHADASLVVIAGAISRDQVRLSILDDGSGIARQTTVANPRTGRLGLRSMSERAAAIGASFSISPAPELPGTLVCVEWPGR